MNKINSITNNYPALCRIVVLFMAFNFSYATCQSFNLVPNYSFEDYVTCPQKSNNFYPSPWNYPCKKVVGYYNNCCTDVFASVPNNIIGSYCYQYAHTGNGYVLADFLYSGTRSYIQVKLKDGGFKL